MRAPIRDHFRVAISLSFAQKMMKPSNCISTFTLVTFVHQWQSVVYLPVYVMRYAMTTQLVWLNPFKSLAIVTKAVLTIETSRFGRKMAIDILCSV